MHMEEERKPKQIMEVRTEGKEDNIKEKRERTGELKRREIN